MTQQVRINFLNWRPDQEDFAHDGLETCDGVYHQPDGYKEFRGYATGTSVASTTGESDFLDMVPLGDDEVWCAARHYSTVNQVEIGTWNVWGEYTDTAPGSNTTASLQSFAVTELGETIVATAKYYWSSASPNTTTTASGYISYGTNYGSGSSWTDLPNSAVGIVCGKVNNFAVIGNDDTGIPGNNTVRWCAIGDATDWPTPATDDARSKQSGQQVLDAKYGAVRAIAGDDFHGYIFQETGITEMTYVGGDVQFAFDTFEETRGCKYNNRVVEADGRIFFESEFGRHVLANDQVQDIGYGVTDASAPPDTTQGPRIYANHALNLIFFTSNLVYNYKTDQWSRVTGQSPISNYHDRDGIMLQYQNSGGLTYLRDSTGGLPTDVTIRTAERDLNPGGRAMITGIRPLVSTPVASPNIYMRVGASDAPITDAPDAWSATATPETSTNICSFRDEGRYHRAELGITFTSPSQSFSAVLGADILFSPQGKR